MANKVKGFSKLRKEHAGHIDAQHIMSPATDPLLATVVWHCVVLGAFFSLSTNRAKSAVKVYIKLEDETLTEWCNTPEEAVQKLAEINDVLVATAVERGLVTMAS